MSWTPLQRYLAEFLGTFGLLVAITGPALLSLNSMTLLTDFDVRYLMIGFGAGLGLLGLLYALGDVSGGHFNPAVTIGAFVAGRMKARDVVPYLVCQVAGAIVGVATVAGVAHGSTSLWATVTSPGAALGSEGYAGNGSPYTVAMASVFLLELALTFLFVFVILRATEGQSSAKNAAPIGIGLTLTMIHFASLAIDGTSVNPARSFAPAVLSWMFSGDHWALTQNWLFWVAPILGGIVAALADRALRPAPA
ncbi:MAG TPA: aquaporin [Thermoplasmata archaeon]|nr:aquaporin [Thermoplasmata archaeon]